MHIETLRKHRKSLIKARRDMKAKLELLDTLLEEQKREDLRKDFEMLPVIQEDEEPEPLVPEPQRPPIAAEWDAAKAYETAARNAFRNATEVSS